MYYAVYDGEDYLASGYNARSKEDVKIGLISFLEDGLSKKDLKAIKKMTADEICDVKGWTLDYNQTPFPEGKFEDF